MSWLKNMLFEEQPEFEKKDTKPMTVAPVTSMTMPASMSIPTPGITNVGSNSKIKEQLVMTIKSTMDSKYQQFKTLADSMKTVLPDTRSRYGAAFVAAKTSMGITKNDLIKSAQMSLNALNKETADFKNEISLTKTNLTKAAEARSIELNNTLKAKEEQIKALSDEIGKMTLEKAQLEANVNKDMSTILTTEQEFEASRIEVERELNTEVNDLTSYLTE